MKGYVYYSTLFAIFTEAFFATYVIDIKLFYFFLLTNLAIILMIGSVINTRLLFFYGFLLLTGIISVVAKTNTVPHFLMQFVGIVLASFYFYNFFAIYADKTVEIFSDYTRLAFIMAVMGIVIFIYNLATNDIQPLKSIMLEPAHYATIVLPAYYFALTNPKFSRFVWIVILISILLSGSSLGLLGVGLSIFLWFRRIDPVRLIAGAALVAVFFGVAYTTYEPLQQRVDDTSRAFFRQDVSGVNLSTFFLASHFYVAVESASANPLTGSGLGAHELAHEKYVYKLNGVTEFLPYLHINASDAASLMLRVLSDLGLIGVVLLIYFIAANYAPLPGDPSAHVYHIISKAVLLYFFCKLFREGHYFSPEMYFFVFAYVFARRAYVKSLNNEPA
jgi:hypothetical protein